MQAAKNLTRASINHGEAMHAQAHTKAWRSPRFLFPLIILFTLAIACVLVFLLSRPNVAVLGVGSKQYRLTKALTPAQKEKGLGGKPNMPANQGMLFVFPTTGSYCFWMKDMYFPIDIIWVGRDKKVLAVEQNVSPKTYPHAFCPAQNAKYVIELNANQARSAGIEPGARLQF